MHVLARTVGPLSGGTRVELLRHDAESNLLMVETVGKIERIKHHSSFDQAGNQKHHKEVIGRDTIKVWVEPNDLVRLRSRTR